MNAPLEELDWFDRDHLAEQLRAYKCLHCGESAEIVAIPAAPPAYAQVRCLSGHFVKWAGGPQAPARQKRSRRSQRLPRTEDDYCDLCLKTREMLAAGVTLEIRHRRDRAALIDNDEAPDDDLGWICSAPCKGIEIALRAWADHPVA